jgi:FkbM family methyltransferase
MKTIKSSPIYSTIYNLLIYLYFFRKNKLTFTIWRYLWEKSLLLYSGNVKTKFHNKEIVVPNGHWYKLVYYKYPKFNSGIISTIKILTKNSFHIKFIDVGAAVGDTILLVESFSSENITYIAIEGDEDYFKILKNNTHHLKTKINYYCEMLSSKAEKINKIIKENPTTGFSGGIETTFSKTLDELLLSEDHNKLTQQKDIYVLKIDVDGYDGKVLQGSKLFITKKEPIIIFELNPPEILKVNNCIEDYWKLFKENNSYSTFVLLNNRGDFCGIYYDLSENMLNILEDISLNLSTYNGYHFDIIAIPKSFEINLITSIITEIEKCKTKI